MRAALTVVAALGAASLLAACGTAAAPTHRSSSPQHTPSGTISTTTGTTSPPASPSSSASSSAKVVVKPKPVNHCAHNSAPQLVLVHLDVQHLWLCAKHRTAYSTPITSGMVGPYTHTPTGHFHIQGLNRNSVLTLNTGATYDVKYWIPFNAPLFGFHDSSWQHFPYGSPKYKTDGSHGCIHLPLKAIAHLYHWADIGADVTIS